MLIVNTQGNVPFTATRQVMWENKVSFQKLAKNDGFMEWLNYFGDYKCARLFDCLNYITQHAARAVSIVNGAYYTNDYWKYKISEDVENMLELDLREETTYTKKFGYIFGTMKNYPNYLEVTETIMKEINIPWKHGDEPDDKNYTGYLIDDSLVPRKGDLELYVREYDDGSRRPLGIFVRPDKIILLQVSEK